MTSNSWQSIMDHKSVKIFLTFIIAVVWTSCNDSLQNVNGPGAGSSAKGKITTMDTPVLSCGSSTQASINVTVTAGLNTGAPAGFTLQWQTATHYAAHGWDSPDSACAGSFSGNANLSRYNLSAGQSVTVNIGEFLFDNGASTSCLSALTCGTDYVFRVFAHANATLYRSAFSANTTCSTLPCTNADNCTLGQGYWKNHGAAGNASPKIYDGLGNLIGYQDLWPVTSLTLGNVTYSESQLQSIFDAPAQGNGLIALAHQLIAAKLNIAKGADGSAIASDIAAADALIGDLVIPPVGSDSLKPNATSALTTSLENFNEGATGPGHCNN
jgi:hypothetical protein